MIALSSSDTTEGTVSPASLTFTAGNWSAAQTVTVTGVDDDVADGGIAYSIVTAAAVSADATYNGINPDDVSVTNSDDDAAGITVDPTSGLVTTEAGGTATFTVVLDSQPTADVTIALSSSDTTEGTVSPASLTFTAANWSAAQTVTVTGVDDDVADGDIAYSIVTATAVSADATYSGINPDDVSVTNSDDDAAGITVDPTSGLVTTEAGGTATFTVVLDSQPTADVTIALSSSDTTEGTVSPASLTFTAANWSAAQTVTVTGVDDDVADGDIAYSIVTATAVSADATYSGINPDDVSVTNSDDDAAGITVDPTSGLVTTEAGGTATFTVVLNSQPTADVVIALSSSDTTEGTVSPASLTFTAGNWSAAQTVTVTGVDDDVADGGIAYSIVTAAAVSADATYNGINPDDVSVTNSDDDAAGITVDPTSGLITTEAGGTATFTVVLDSQPTADVTIALSSDDATEGIVAPDSLTFTAGNWNAPQTVTVTGVDDDEVDDDIAYTIITAPAVSADANYHGIDPADVSVTNSNDDVATAELLAFKSVVQVGTHRLPVIYEIVVNNVGDGDQPDDPASHELIDMLADELSLLDATADSGTVTPDVAGNAVYWNGLLPAGGSVLIRIRATVNATDPMMISNQAQVNFDGDGDGSNDSQALSTDPTVAGNEQPTVFRFVGAPPPPPVMIPSAGALALWTLLALMLGVGAARLRRAA